MLRTNSEKVLFLEGIDQQDFTQLQLVQGSYPFQVGLQKRIPGKSITQIYAGPVGSIYVFYQVFGRFYTLIDFGNILIEEVEIPTITLPGLPPAAVEWFDNFDGYTLGLISRLWGAGAWLIGVGVCETIIEGYIDPYRVLGTVEGYQEDIPTEQRPVPEPPADTPTVPPLIPPTGPQYPVECGELPDQFYQVFATGLIFDAIQKIGGSADTGEVASVFGGSPPPYIAHPYANQIGGALNAQENAIRQHYFNGLSWVTRSRSSGFRNEAHFDIEALELPYDAEIWLVGTKSLSDGTGGLFPNLETTCASLQIATLGEKSGTITISTEMGIDTISIANEGILAYTEIRVYSSTYAFNF